MNTCGMLSPEVNKAIADIIQYHKSNGMPHMEAKKKALDDALARIYQLTSSGSSATDIDINNFQADITYTLNNNNLDTVFNDMVAYGNTANTSDEHIDYLRNMFRNMAARVFNKVDDVKVALARKGSDVLGRADVINDSIYLQTNATTVANNITMSTAEVFAHEFSHIFLAPFTRDPSNKTTMDHVDRLWEQSKDFLDKKYGKGNGYKAFLHTDDDGNIIYVNDARQEREAAKAQYNYIFNKQTMHTASVHPITGQTREASGYLEEFLVFALTNEHLRNNLEEMVITFKDNETLPKELLPKLSAIWDRIVNYVAGMLSGTPNKTGTEAVDVLVHRLTKGRAKMFKFSKAMQSVIDETNSVTSKWLNTGLNKVGTIAQRKLIEDIEKTSLNEDGSLVNLSYHALKQVSLLAVGNLASREKSLTHFNVFQDVLRHGTRLNGTNAIAELVREVKGHPPEFINKLNMTKRLIDQNRKNTINNYKRFIGELTEGISKKESIALKKVLLDLDLSALTDKYSTKEISDFIQDSTLLNAEIDKLKNQIKKATNNPRIAGYVLQQSRALGEFLAKGKVTTLNLGLNADIIASGKLTGFPKGFPKGTTTALVPLIDALASLHGIKYTDIKLRMQAIKAIDIDAVNQLLNLHIAFKSSSKRLLFNDNPNKIIKGYTVDIYNPYIDVKVSSSDNDIGLISNGYTLVTDHTLELDSRESAGKAKFLYVNKNGAIPPRVQQIVSLTNQRMRGSSVLERELNSGDNYLDYESAEEYIAYINESAKNNNNIFDENFSSTENSLVPSVDANGDIMDYRYLMSKHTKDTLLEADNTLDEVFSRTMASIVDKVNTTSVNRDTVSFLKKVMDEEMVDPIKKANYVTISPESKDKNVRDAYALMPADMKQEIAKVFGKDTGLQINREYFHILFGYSKLKLSKKKIGSLVERTLEEITGIAKNNIVIKSTVVVGNTISNIIINMWNGVPIDYQIRHMFLALKGIRDYKDAYHKLSQLRIKLNAEQDTLTKAAKKQIEADISKYKDRISRNPVTELVDAGLFQTIVEDVDPNEDKWTLRRKFLDWVSPFTDKFKDSNPLVIAGKHAYITNDTKLYELLLHTTQVSDFMSRATLHWYQTQEKGMSSLESLKNVNDDFVNYEAYTNKYLQYGNDIGLIWFSKFFLRIQRVILRKFSERPASVLSSITMQNLLMGDVEDITDSLAFIEKNPLNIVHIPPFQALDAATTFNGYELVFN